MEQDRYGELLNTLRRWRDCFAENLLDQVESIDRHHQQAQNIYANEGVGEAFAPWLDRFCRQLAIQFILKILFIRVLEDRNLLKIRRIRSRDSQQLFDALAPHLGVTSYLRFVFRDVARLLPDLFAEGEQDILWPADNLSHEFLEEVWRRPDVEREGRLRYDFRGDGEDGFDTRFIGDFYQDIDPEAREYYALLQTPKFISQFILEHTLLKRFDEKDFREVTLIDPTCGSGHFLVDAFYHFTQEFLKAGDYPETPSDKAKLARKIIEEHIFGADINPYACALARFRLILAACDFARPTDLDAFRDPRFNIVCCDSLIPYEKPEVLSFQVGLEQGQADVEVDEERRFGSPATIVAARELFSHRFDIVVGNPPYISVRDRQKRDLYREYYVSAYRSYGLVAPFTERFLQISTGNDNGGCVGMIVTNAFARRLYGKKLIEDVLPRYDLQSVIDLGGAYIPGHGTPTLIMFLRSKSPQDDTVRVVSNIKGEPGTPRNPEDGEVWQSVVKGFNEGHGYHDEYVDVYDNPRRIMSKHPWQFGGPASRLYERILLEPTNRLERLADDFGYSLQTNADEVFLISADYARRLSLPRKYVRQFAIGEAIRNWLAWRVDHIVFPYNEGLQLIEIEDIPALNHYLSIYKEVLGNRVVFGGQTYFEAEKPWYCYHQFSTGKHETPQLLTHAFIATHNHFLIESSQVLFNRSAPVVKLPPHASDHEQNAFLCGIMNSSVVCFCLKQISYNKGTGKDPVRDRYEQSSSQVKATPIPADYDKDTPNYQRVLSLSLEMIHLASDLQSLGSYQPFEMKDEAYYSWNVALDGYCPPHHDLPQPFHVHRELEFVRDYSIELRRDIRQRMMFIQEEMDWMAYEMYGLIPHSPITENYLTPTEFENARMELGQRAFEQAGNGYKGDWLESWKNGARDYFPGPEAHLPQLSENMKRLIQTRIKVIQTVKDIALLEDPLYKRRWEPLDYEKEFREALEWWMCEMAEWELEQACSPLHIKEWSRRLMAHERVRAALEVYTGTPTYVPVATIEKIIAPLAVPNRPEHFMGASGLQKLARGEMEFERADFSDGNAWRVRGKLNIPRERYIAYKAFEPGWYGWAGWGAEKRAEALVYLLEQAGTEDWSVHHLQCGLRASLRDLLPDLEDLPAAERLEFETIAYLCGIRESCFCTPFREADPEERPPGFDGPSIKQHTGGPESEQISVF